MPRTGQITRHVGAVGTRRPKQRGLFHLFGGDAGRTRMLISANDYAGTGHELSCTEDANHLQNLAKACDIEVNAIFNHQCTHDGLLNAIHNVASQCGPKDTFIFYFSGHGTQVTDMDGDEVDGQDEAYVCVTDTGSIFEPDGNPCVLTDDALVEVLINALHPEATCILLSDCCHSGSIADLHKPVFNGRRSISISGCKDAQTSGDIGQGGICTWAMLLATEALQQAGKTSYSVLDFYHEVLRQDAGVFDSKQDITLDKAKGINLHDIGWPLIPKRPYQTPQLSAKYKKIGLPPALGLRDKVATSGAPPSYVTQQAAPSTYATHLSTSYVPNLSNSYVPSPSPFHPPAHNSYAQPVLVGTDTYLDASRPPASHVSGYPHYGVSAYGAAPISPSTTIAYPPLHSTPVSIHAAPAMSAFGSAPAYRPPQEPLAVMTG